MKNREKILLSARRLFNEKGFLNVRLQHISDDTIISLGNIAYHFSNKEALISEIFKELEDRHWEALREYRNVPIFSSFERILVTLEAIQNDFGFFYTDLIEINRSYPDLFQRLHVFFQSQKRMLTEILTFNISRGALEQTHETQKMDHLATLLLHNINTWGALKQTSGTDQEEVAHNLSDFIWQILIPYMTPTGMEEYQLLKEQTLRFPD